MMPLAPVPDLSLLPAALQTWALTFVLALAGRLLLRGKGGLAAQILSGWGALCLILLVWGVVLRLPLAPAAWGFMAMALLGLKSGGMKGWVLDWNRSWRVLVMTLPLLLVTWDMQPSQTDVFLVMIPNTAYLADHGAFPVSGGPSAFSDVPVAPYGKELALYLAALLGGYSASLPSLWAVVLHLVPALIFAQALSGDERPPGWGEAALGVALATLIDPAFAPRVAFSGLGEPHMAITLMTASWLAARSLAEMAADRRRIAPSLFALMLVLAALIGIKQQSIGLLIAFSTAVTLAAWLEGGVRRALPLAAATLPAFLLFVLWRLHVTWRFPEGELAALPPDQWAVSALPQILAAVGLVMVAKPYYFGCVAAVIALAARPPHWLRPESKRVARLGAVLFPLYSGFLVLTYVIHFREEHSFFRYNAHLSMVMGLALILAARDWLATRPKLRSGLERPGTWIAITVMVAAPVGGIHLLRYDLDQPQPQLRAAARMAAQEIKDGDTLTVILPGDDTTASLAFESALRFAPPRRHGLILVFENALRSDSLEKARQRGSTAVFLSCTDGNGLGLPEGSAALLRPTPHGWHATNVWAWPEPPPRKWWNSAGYLVSAPFCIKSGHKARVLVQ